MPTTDDSADAGRPSAVARARRVAARPAPEPTARQRGPQPGVTFHPTPEPRHATPDPGAKRPTRAGRDLPAAIGVGVGLAAVIVPALFVWRPSFAIVVGVAVLYGCWEMARAFRPAGIFVCITPVLAGGAAVLIAAWERGSSGLVLAALVTLVGILVWRIADGAYGYTRDVSASVFVLLYVPTLAGFAVLLVHPHDGAARILAFAATVVCSDTGGYATGVLFGKHPLAPVVSKAKTWEGFTGSVITCATSGVLFMHFVFHEAWWKGLLFGVAIAVTATLGDLGESLIKRDLDIKDMGNLLPGHGGVMDRLDSMLPCAAVAYLLLSTFAPV